MTKMRSRNSMARIAMIVLATASLAYGIVAGSVWVNNKITHSPYDFIGEVGVFGVPLVTESPFLGWLAAGSTCAGCLGIWRSQRK